MAGRYFAWVLWYFDWVLRRRGGVRKADGRSNAGDAPSAT